MNNSHWTTKSSAGQREHATWPTPDSTLRQGAVLIVVMLILSGLLAGCLGQPSANPTAMQATPTVAKPADAPVPTAPAPASGIQTTPKPTQAPAQATATVPAQTGSVSFAQKVLPIFEQRCASCHGAANPRAGLALTTYANVIKGSANGRVVEPGNPSNSLLVKLVTSGQMPRSGARLTPAEVQVISDWVQAGAPNN